MAVCTEEGSWPIEHIATSSSIGMLEEVIPMEGKGERERNRSGKEGLVTAGAKSRAGSGKDAAGWLCLAQGTHLRRGGSLLTAGTVVEVQETRRNMKCPLEL